MATNRLGHIAVIILAIFQSHDFAASASDLVLLKTIVPRQYNLNVSIHTESLTYSVKETVQLDILQISSNISLHSSTEWKSWNEVSLTCGTQRLPVTNVSFNQNVVTISFARDIPIGGCALGINLMEKRPLKEANGIYVSPNSHNIITQFQPNLTHNVFPCFDEPQFKAKFVLTVQHSRKYIALSNTKQLNSICSDATQLCVTDFSESPLMSPSSFAFSLTVDTALSRSVNSINYRVFGPIANKETAYKWAIDFSSNALAQAQQWLKRNYQLQQIDFLSVKNLSAANDNSWGLIKIREPFLYFNLSNPLDVPIEVHQKSALAILDGIMSSWFDHEVTPNGDEAIFLNRGLSTFIQYIIMNQSDPDWRFMDQFVIRELQRSLANSTIEQDPISELEKSAATSASIMRMMVLTVGPKAFQNAVQQYLTTSSMGTVQPVQLFNAIQVEVNKEPIKLPATVQQIFRDWFRARDAVPTIRISRRYDNSSTVNITYVGPAPSKFVPISFASQSKPVPDKLLWLAPNSTEINSYKIDANDSQWLLVNNHATGGYYRVLYDIKNWQLLIAQLKSKNFQNIHSQTRAQLIDDAFYFAQNGLLSYDLVFDLLTYLQGERDFIPWASAKRSLDLMDRMIRGFSVHLNLEFFICKITADLYPELSVANQNERNHVKRLERLSVTKMACEAGEQRCIKEINQMARSVLDKTKYIVPELQELIFCAASRYILKPRSDLEQALSSYIMSMIQQKNRTDDESMTRAAFGLGCTRNDEIINKALGMTIMVFPPIMNIEIRRADRELLFKAIAVGSFEGTRAALIFMDKNYDTMRQRFVSMPSVVDAIAPHITFMGLNGLLHKFATNHESKFDDKMKLAVARAKATAQMNENWMATNQNGISTWLIANIETGSGATSLTVNLVMIAAATLLVVFLRQ